MEQKQEWSKEWKGSTDPGKQRKYRANAPYHQRQQFLSARLADDVQDNIETTSMPVREGDEVRIERGDNSGETGTVRDIDVDEYKIYIDGVNRDTVSGSEVTVAIDPSNVVVTKLNLDDDRRVAKYEMTEEEKEQISADTAAEPEESTEDEDETEDAAGTEEEAQEDMDEVTAADVDYDAVVDGTVDEVKDRVRDDDLDPEQVLEEEKDNKDRKTLVEWLENRIGDTDE